MLTEFNFLSPEKSGSSGKLSSSKNKKKKKKEKSDRKDDCDEKKKSSSKSSVYPLTSTQINNHGNDSLLELEGNPFQESEETSGKSRRGTSRLSLEEKMFQRQLEEAMELSRAGDMSSTLPLSQKDSSSPLEVIDAGMPNPPPVDAEGSHPPSSSGSNKENKITISIKKKTPYIALLDDDSDDDFPEGPVSLKSFKNKNPPIKETTKPILNNSSKRKREDESSKNTIPKEKVPDQYPSKAVEKEPKSSSHQNSGDKKVNPPVVQPPQKKGSFNPCDSPKPSTSKGIRVKYREEYDKNFSDEEEEEEYQEEPESEEEYSPPSKKSSKKSSAKKDKKKSISPKASKNKSSSSSSKKKKKADAHPMSDDDNNEAKIPGTKIKTPVKAPNKQPQPMPSVITATPAKTPSLAQASGNKPKAPYKPSTVLPTPSASPKTPVVPSVSVAKLKASNISHSPKTPVVPNVAKAPITPNSVPRTNSLKAIPKWTPPARIGQNSTSGASSDVKSSPSLGIRVGLSRKFKAAKPLHSNVKFTP